MLRKLRFTTEVTCLKKSTNTYYDIMAQMIKKLMLKTETSILCDVYYRAIKINIAFKAIKFNIIESEFAELKGQDSGYL